MVFKRGNRKAAASGSGTASDCVGAVNGRSEMAERKPEIPTSNETADATLGVGDRREGENLDVNAEENSGTTLKRIRRKKQIANDLEAPGIKARVKKVRVSSRVTKTSKNGVSKSPKKRSVVKKVKLEEMAIKERVRKANERSAEADETREDATKPTKNKSSTPKKVRFQEVKIEEELTEEVEEGLVKKRRKLVVGMSEIQASSAATVGSKVLTAAKNCKKMLGMHTSAAGSLEQSIYNAVAIGCRAFALFVRNQRTWKCPPLADDVVERFKEAIEKHPYPLSQIMPHGSYLINAGSSDVEKLQKSRDGMLDECQRCERVGITQYNFHPGSTAGACSVDDCIRTIAETVNYILERTAFITLVLETMAGQGHTIGGKFEELRQIIDLVNDRKRVGVCIDTCHIFAAGYDIRTKETYERTMSEFDKIIGFKFLRGLHINDSKGDLGSKLDRHMNIGKGKITMSGFANFMNDPRLDGIPMILETPAGSEDDEMIRLYSTVIEEIQSIP